METNLIKMGETRPTFKSAALNEATAKLFDLNAKQHSAFDAAEKSIAITRKAIASILADIEARKLYKEDGFKSLAEYGDTIGLDKSMTHKLENAGRLLNSGNDSIKDFAAKADWSKLAILASADPAEVAKAIKEKKLTTDSTAEEVKAWKKSAEESKPKTGKVLPKYAIDLTLFDRNGATDYHFDAIELEMVTQLEGFTVSSVKNPETGAITFYGIHPDGRMVRYTKQRVKAAESTVKPVIDLSKLSDEQVQALIAEYNARRKAK